MKSNLQRQRPAKIISRSASKPASPAKTRKIAAKKIAIREGTIRVPVRSGGSDAAILFFDEGDALFGKRTTVRDSHDRFSAAAPKPLASDTKKRAGKKALRRVH